MIQKEVAERLAAPPGNKAYGILSVLLQRFYKIEYCFTVPPHVFLPPPKVQSAVIRLQALNTSLLDCNEKFYFTIVKAAFNQRRKTLRNALKAFLPEGKTHDFMSRRAEQLSPQEFEELCVWIEQAK
jgi:16S rRNA (adenine1518-N6/adenine1519-N6)-dimethyltransferase